MVKYIRPSVKVDEAQPAQMLAESLSVIGGKTVDGSEALTKENNDLNIWDGEE